MSRYLGKENEEKFPCATTLIVSADRVNDGCLLVCVDDSNVIADSPSRDVDVTVEVVDIHWEKTGLPFISWQINITILNLHT